MTQQCVHPLILAILFYLHLSICPTTELPDPTDPSRYLNAIRTFTDNVIKYGRDTYDPKHTPLTACAS